MTAPDLATELERECDRLLAMKESIAANLAHYDLPDPLVRLRLRFTQGERCWTWFDDEGMRVTKTVAEVEASSDMEVMECQEFTRVTAEIWLESEPGLLSNLIVDAKNFPYTPGAKALTEQGWQASCITDVRLDLDDTYMGYVDCDCLFVYEDAHTVREFIGYAWCSGIGCAKSVTADLNAASALVCRYINGNGGRVMFEGWEDTLSKVYVRNQTVSFGSGPLINPTLAVATKLLIGKEHPGFNICW